MDQLARRRAGVTLLEALVTLAIIVVMFAVASSSITGPSERQKVRGLISDVLSHANETRTKAIRSGNAVAFEPAGGAAAWCAEDAAPDFEYFADGTASIDRFCLVIDAVTYTFTVDQLTGRASAE